MNAANIIDGNLVDTTEFQLTKDFFENLGLIMQEYLSTTSLGDLFRKAKDAAINNNANAAAAEATRQEAAANDNAEVINNTNSPMGISAIRPNIGEANQ